MHPLDTIPFGLPALQLKDVIPGAIFALNPSLFAGASAFSGANIPLSSHVIVLLIDGLGEIQLQEFAPSLLLSESSIATPMLTHFPSTTPVALGSLGTGQSPGQHGFVGASFLPAGGRCPVCAVAMGLSPTSACDDSFGTVI